jgi:coproporphyrinogen III oxidase-like Fe-S oxidoreductase
VSQQNCERREPVPAYFFPLLSKEDSADPERLLAFLRQAVPGVEPRSRGLLYVHIPFCRDHCRFCGFYRKTLREHENSQVLSRYVDRLLAELKCWSDSGVLQSLRLDAVYVGGGTPSLMSPDLIRTLLEGIRRLVPVKPGTELTFEGEARSLADRERLSVLRALGVSRVSFGVQSFAEPLRREMGMGASLKDVARCAEAVKDEGYGVCLDLMYGLPGQTEDGFLRDLKVAVEELDAELIDLYELVLYPNTALFADRHRAGSTIPDDARRAAMYRIALEYFASAGFQQWTLEDFCKPGTGYLMKHLTYGGGDGQAPVLALGACAMGYLEGHAYRNLNLGAYLQHPDSQLPIALLRQASHSELRRRPLFFFPRRLTLDPRRVAVPLEGEDLELLEGFLAKGYARWLDGQVVLTRKGKLSADRLVSRALNGKERRKMFKLIQGMQAGAGPGLP